MDWGLFLLGAGFGILIGVFLTLEWARRQLDELLRRMK